MASSKTLDPHDSKHSERLRAWTAQAGSWCRTSSRLGGCGEESQVVLSTSGNHSNKKSWDRDLASGKLTVRHGIDEP